MKFKKRTDNNIPHWKIQKPEVVTKIQDGGGRHLEFYIKRCHFVANWPIFTKFCMEVRLWVPEIKIQKPEVLREIQDGGCGHIVY